MKKHAQYKSILLVVEGYADEYLIRYLKDKYHARGSEFKIYIKNARGKGALNVISHASKLQNQGSYNAVYVLFDTDTDWNDGAKKIIKDNHLFDFRCDPCLEAELLRLSGIHVTGLTKNIKKDFFKKFNCDADRIQNYEKVVPEYEKIKVLPNNTWIIGIINLLMTSDHRS